MKKISVYRPTTIEEAQQMLSMHGTDAAVYAGGTDLLIRLKNRLKQAPAYLVDIKKINNLRYIKEDAQGGVQIGALTKLAEIAESDLLAKKYPMLVSVYGGPSTNGASENFSPASALAEYGFLILRLDARSADRPCTASPDRGMTACAGPATTGGNLTAFPDAGGFRCPPTARSSSVPTAPQRRSTPSTAPPQSRPTATPNS